jgi:uncharacterized protein YpiB (UPF0302 family)
MVKKDMKRYLLKKRHIKAEDIGTFLEYLLIKEILIMINIS